MAAHTGLWWLCAASLGVRTSAGFNQDMHTHTHNTQHVRWQALMNARRKSDAGNKPFLMLSVSVSLFWGDVRCGKESLEEIVEIPH